MKRSYVRFGLAVALLAFAQVASAVTGVWINAADGDFSDTGNWQGGVVPTAVGDYATFTNTDSYTVTLDASVTNDQVRFNATGGAQAVDLSGNTWGVTGILYVGSSSPGNANVTLSGGALSTRSLQLGNQTSAGELTLVGATATVYAAAGLGVGMTGSGRVTLATEDTVLMVSTSGATANPVGNGAGSYGAIVVSNGLLSVAGSLYVGNGGSGDLWLGNGTGVVVSTLGIGYSAGATGRVTLAGPGAALSGSPRMGVATGSLGAVYVSNGLWQTSGEVKLGEDGQALVVLDGGSLYANTSSVNAHIYIPFAQGTSRVMLTSADSKLTQIGNSSALQISNGTNGYGELIVSNGMLEVTEIDIADGRYTAGAMYLYNGTCVVSHTGGSSINVGSDNYSTGLLVVADSRALIVATNGTGLVFAGSGATRSNSVGNMDFSAGTVLTRGFRMAYSRDSRSEVVMGDATLVNRQDTGITVANGINSDAQLVLTHANSLVDCTNTAVGNPVILGASTGSYGRLLMSNGTMRLNRLVVGNTGVGLMTMENQAQVAVKENIYIPNSATGLGTGTGTLVLASSLASLTATVGTTVVGANWAGAKAGSGTVIISNGTMNIRLLNVGSACDGLVTVMDGAIQQGSTSLGDGVKIGTSTEGGTGTLVLAHANALLNTPANNLVLANAANSSGRLLLSNGLALVRSIQTAGTASSMTNTSSAIVIEAATLAATVECQLGNGAASQGSVVLAHPDALLSVTGIEVRMSYATNTFTSLVLSNGTMQARAINMGSGTIGSPTAQNAEWITYNATNRLVGLTNAAAFITIGNRPACTGLMVLAHAGAVVDLQNVGNYGQPDTHIGELGVGALLVSNGLLNIGNLVVGHSTGSLGYVRIEGGSVSVRGDLRVGRAGTGTLSIAGGQVSGNTLSMVFTNTSTNASATVELSGGTLAVSNMVSASAVGAQSNLWLSGGTLLALKNFTNSITTTLTNSPGPGLFTFSTAFTNLQSGVLTGPGGLAKAGVGLLNLTQVNDYTGETVVNEGTLALIGSATIANSTQITVAAGATLDASSPGLLTVGAGQVIKGGGSVLGSLISDGTTAPGASPGTLSVTGDYQNNGTLALEIGGTTPGTEHDVLAVSGEAGLGGTIQVTLVDGFTPSGGQSFTVLTATAVSGSFSSTDLPSGDWSVDVQADQVVLNYTGSGGGSAELSVSPTNLTFAATKVGEYSELTFTVNNSGDVQLDGTATVATAGFTIQSGSPFSVAASGSASVTVRFTPTESGSYGGDVTFLSNGSNSINAVSGTGYVQASATNEAITLVSGRPSFGFTLVSGALYRVQASTNLLDGSSWMDVTEYLTNNYPGGLIPAYSETNTATYPRRAYRISSP